MKSPSQRLLPKRSQSQRIGTKAERLFESHIDDALFITRRIKEQDFGVDYHLEVVTPDETCTNFYIPVQLKGTQAKSRRDGSVKININVSNLNYLIADDKSIYIAISLEDGLVLYETASTIQRQYEANPTKHANAKTISVTFRKIFDSDAQKMLHATALALGNKRLGFRSGFGKMPVREWSAHAVSNQVPDIPIPETVADAIELLQSHISRNEDAFVYRSRDEYRARFPDSRKVEYWINISAVNLAMTGHKIDHSEIERAASNWELILQQLWNSMEAKHKAGLLYNLGNAHSALRNTTVAQKAYNKSLEIHPEDACHTNLGKLLEENGALEEAENHYRAALTLYEFRPEPNFSLARVLQARQDWKTSLYYLDLCNDPNRPAIAAMQARASFEIGDHRTAIAKARQILESNTKDEHCTHTALFILFDTHNKADPRLHSHIRRTIRDHLSRSPDDGDLWFGLATLVQQAHGFQPESPSDAEELEEALRNAIALNCSDISLAHDRLAHLLDHLGHQESAIEHFKKAAERDEGNYGFCYGAALLSNGQHIEALPWLKRASEVHIPDAISHFKYALALLRANQHADAEQAFQRSIELDPDYCAPQVELGGLFWNTKRVPEAIQIWQQALKKWPTDPRAAQIHSALKSIS